MTTNSYLEYALTLLGWVISNGLWNIITATGLFAFPLLCRCLALWLKAREQGVDEGDAGGLTLSWMENSMYMAVLVIMFTCVPLINIDMSQIQYDDQRSAQCNFNSPVKPEDTGYAPLINDVSGQTASVPVWWYLIHVVSKGVTAAATATLPCKPDLRQLRFDIQHTRINDPILAQELQDFVLECYAPSLARLKQQEEGMDSPAETDDINWIGSAYFLTTPGYYDTDHARSPHAAWSYDSNRDAGLADTGQGGYPTCKQWWSASDSGLRTRLLSRVEPNIWERLHSLTYTQEETEEAVLRTLVSPRNMTVSQSGRVYAGYGGNVNPTFTNSLSSAGAVAGQALASLAAFPAFDAIRQALPTVQALLLMALVICIPLVTVFSAYNIKAVLTLTFAFFGLTFLTFWWDLARWLDGWYLTLLYDSDTHSSWNMMGLQNTQDDLIMEFVMGSLFLLLPGFWIGALSWAGLKLGGVIEKATVKSGGDVGAEVKKEGEKVSSRGIYK